MITENIDWNLYRFYRMPGGSVEYKSLSMGFAEVLPLPNPISGLAICPSGNLLLKGADNAPIIYNGGFRYPDHFLSGTSDPATWMIRERYKKDKKPVFAGVVKTNDVAGGVINSQGIGTFSGASLGKQEVQLPNGRTFKFSPPKSEVWGDSGECVYLGVGAKSLAVNPFGDLYIYGTPEIGHDWILRGSGSSPRLHPAQWELVEYTPGPGAKVFVPSAQQAPPPSAAYQCSTCGKADLNSGDLEVNPVTGNIWGCPKCGGKKLQETRAGQVRVEEEQADLKFSFLKANSYIVPKGAVTEQMILDAMHELRRGPIYFFTPERFFKSKP